MRPDPAYNQPPHLPSRAQRVANFISVGSCLSALPGAFLMADDKCARLNTVKPDRRPSDGDGRSG